MKVKFFFFPIVFVLLLCLVSNRVGATAIPFVSDSTLQDSIPTIDYIGYRLYFTHFEVVKKKKEWLYIKLSVINTGNKNMQLGRGASQVFPVAKFDPSIGQAALLDYQTEIYYKLLEQKLTIPIGAITTNIELKLLLEESDSAIAAREEVATPKKTKKKKQKNPPVKKEPKKEIVAIETAVIPDPVETVVPEEDQEVVKEVEAPVVEEPKAVETVVEVVETPEEESTCADLVLQQVTIIKRSKNNVVLQYQLLNQGTGTAPLIIGRKKEQQSLAIRANLSSSEKLTRGAIPLGGTFLHGDEISLASGETYTGELKFALHKLTRFTPILILELDAYEFVHECNEFNNLSTLRLLEEQ